MYILTNKENVIVAISDDLLEKLNLNDICLVSQAIKNNLVSFDKEKNELKLINNDVYNYQSSTLSSLLGELNLYTLKEKQEEVKEKEIEKEIQPPSFEEELLLTPKEEKESPSKIEEEYRKLQEMKESAKELLKESEAPEIKEEEIKTPSEVTLLDTKDLELVKSDITPLETKELKIPKIPQEALEEVQEKIEDNIKVELQKDEISLENTQIDLQKEEIELPKDEISLKDELKLEDIAKDVVSEIKPQEESIKKEPLKSEHIEPLAKELEEEAAGVIKLDTEPVIEEKPIEKTKDRLEEKLKEELEARKEPKEEFIKIDDVSYTQDSDISKILEESESRDKKGIFSKKLFPWGKKKDTEETQIEEALEIKETIKEDFKPTLEEQIKEQVVAPFKEEEVDVAKKPQETLENRFLKLEEALLEDEKEDLKEVEVKKEEISPLSLLEKEIKEIDFEANAKKLNLDIKSYKMLLNSYLDEIKGHLGELERGNEEIKGMLLDAGELLSLTPITSKIKKLSLNPSENEEIIKEISHSLELIKNKLEQKEEPKKEELVAKELAEVESTFKEPQEIKIANEVETTPQIKEEKEVTEAKKEEELASTNVAEDAIELSNSFALLEKIEPQEQTLDLESTAIELNLPKELIYEFIKDFLDQIKEHLDIFIEAYKNKDLEKIHTTAHMLKGAANNLRLNKIGDVLFKLQKEDNFDNIDILIKKFAAQIKGLENALNKVGE